MIDGEIVSSISEPPNVTPAGAQTPSSKGRSSMRRRRRTSLANDLQAHVRSSPSHQFSRSIVREPDEQRTRTSPLWVQDAFELGRWKHLSSTSTRSAATSDSESVAVVGAAPQPHL